MTLKPVTALLAVLAGCGLVVNGQPAAAQTKVNIGHVLAQRTFRSADLYAGLIMLGTVGFAASACLRLAERRLLSWRDVAR